MDDIYESEVRSAGDLAGIFEFDGETSYFYFYSTDTPGPEKVLAAIRIAVGEPDFKASDVVIRWDSREEFVGLFIAGGLRAAFDAVGRAFGPATLDASRALPEEVLQRFDTD